MLLLPLTLLLAAPTADEAAVMAQIDAMFAALAARDGTAILAQTRPGGGATVATERPDGTRAIRYLTSAEFAAGIKPGPEKYEERLTGRKVEVDGDIAMVWSPYLFLIDGKVHHCGVNHFSLAREKGEWKVASISWTSRTIGCPAA